MQEILVETPVESRESMLQMLGRCQRKLSDNVEQGDLTWKQAAQPLSQLAFLRDGLVDYPPMAEIPDTVRSRYQGLINFVADFYTNMVMGVKDNG